MASVCALSLSLAPYQHLRPPPLLSQLKAPPYPFSYPSRSLSKLPPWTIRRAPNTTTCSAEPSLSAPPPNSQPDAPSPPPPPPPSPSSSVSYISCAALGAAGFLETSYLTLAKLTGGAAFCPAAGGGGCGDVLDSDYASILEAIKNSASSYLFSHGKGRDLHFQGIPLPIFGMVAYGSVAAIGFQLSRNTFMLGLGKTEARIILLGLTTSMAAASACFLYILSTRFAGVTCPYCLFSAFLSFTLFFTVLTDFGFQEIQKVAVLQFAAAGLVVAAITGSYNALQPQIPSSADFELELYETEITTKSTPLAISLAKHLHTIGAKMYGAFWCSHCIEQKEMFGTEAMKIVDYVECFPDGAGKGREMAKMCKDIGIEGFPTWMINDQLLSGEQDLQSLAEASGFVISEEPGSPPVIVKP